MTAQAPLLLVKNVFDVITQYQLGTISTSSETLGREARRVGAYRRDRQIWQPLNDGVANSPQGNWVRVDLSVNGSEATSMGFIDRGHNLWGKNITFRGGPDGATWPSSFTRAVPALNADGSVAPGGDPTTGIAVTEEGALWASWTLTAARRYWELFVPYVASFVPVVPSVVLGPAHQVSGFSKVFDDDAGARKMASAESDAGWLAAGRVYSWRTAELQLSLIGAPEYDAQIRLHRTLLFARGVPGLLCWDWGTHPERAGLFTFDGTAWKFGTQKYYRSGTIPLREHYPRTTY
jgi:hypothetical protein